MDEHAFKYYYHHRELFLFVKNTYYYRNAFLKTRFMNAQINISDVLLC